MSFALHENVNLLFWIYGFLSMNSNCNHNSWSSILMFKLVLFPLVRWAGPTVIWLFLSFFIRIFAQRYNIKCCFFRYFGLSIHDFKSKLYSFLPHLNSEMTCLDLHQTSRQILHESIVRIIQDTCINKVYTSWCIVTFYYK